MVKRRSMVIGLGALATGSGAVFSSAAFANSAQAGANFQVVVEDELIAEAGDAFRNGESFRVGNSSGEFRDIGSNDIFSDGGGLGDVSFEDLPVAGATNGANDELNLAVATEIETEHTFEDFIQVRNEGTESKDVAIDFSNFGTATDDGGADLAKALVGTVYQFESGGQTISPDPTTPGGALTENPEEYVTVEEGSTVQIDLTVDTTDTTVRQRLSDYVESNGNTNPFAEDGDRATIDLVDKIRIGTPEDSSE